MGDDRPSVYREGDNWIIRASALGGCTRALVAAGRDVEPNATPEWLQAKFDQGHEAEDAIRQHYLETRTLPELSSDVMLGLYAEDGQWGFDLMVAPGIVIRGHMDDIGAEYKALAPSTYANAMTKGINVLPTYPWQVACYMAATGLDEWDWVCVEKDKEGQPKLETMHVTRITELPHTLQEIALRAVEVVLWIEDEDYDAYPACQLPLQYPCPYFLLHDEEVVPELEGVDAFYMKQLVGRLDHIKTVIKLQEERKAATYESIQSVMKDRPTVMVDGTRITWVHTETPEHMSNPKPKLVKAKVVDYPKITPPKKAKE